MRRGATLHGVVFDILLIRVLIRFRPARNDVGAGQPAVQIDVTAAFGAKGFRRLGGRLAADRALLRSPPARAGAPWWLSWHSTSRSELENLRRRAARSIHTAASRRYWCRSRPS